jgi:hypothetical protein
MAVKGQVSSVDLVNHKARVTFRDMDNVVSSEIPYAQHVALEVNDTVAVIFFSANKSDGLIIGVF